MKNMCEVSNSSKIYTFDMKGSTVDREVIKLSKLKLLKGDDESEKATIIAKISKEVLKDKDFMNLGLKFNISSKDAELFRKMVKSDAEYLRDFQITDYSLFVTIHKYSEEEFEQVKSNYRVMASTDKKYLFSFSIIDYLGVYILYSIT